MGPGFESPKVHQKKTSIIDGGFSFGIIVPDSIPSKALGLWTGFALRCSAATAPHPGAKRGSESLTRRGFFVPYLSSLTAGDRRRPTDLCAFFTWCAGVVWAVFRFRIAKSSVFSRRRKTPEKRSRSGRHDPYRFVRILHTIGAMFVIS